MAQAPAVEYSAPAAPVQQAAPAAGTYTVQAGDTLGTIANKLGVNGGWQALYAANSGSVADANLIFPGQVLTTTAAAATAAETAPAPAAEAPAPATPAPATSTLAGGTLPAAVTCPVKKRPNSWAASTIAR